MGLQSAYYLHGSYLRCAAKRAGGKRINESLYRVCAIVKRTADTAYKVDYMAVILYVLI